MAVEWAEYQISSEETTHRAMMGINAHAINMERRDTNLGFISSPSRPGGAALAMLSVVASSGLLNPVFLRSLAARSWAALLCTPHSTRWNTVPMAIGRDNTSTTISVVKVPPCPFAATERRSVPLSPQPNTAKSRWRWQKASYLNPRQRC